MGADQPAGPGDGLTPALLDTLLRTAPVGLGFVDADLRFVRVNEVLAAMNGAPAEAHLGRHIAEVLNPGLAATVEPILRRTLETGEPTGDIELSHEGQFWVVSYYPVRDSLHGSDAPPVGVGVVVRDVTDQQAIANEVGVRARHLEAVAQLGQRALISDEFDALLQEGVDLLADILAVDFVHVLEHDRDRAEFFLRLCAGFTTEAHVRISDDIDVQPGFALHNRMPVVVNDTKTETRFRVNPLIEEIGAVSALTVVIRGPGWPYGVLGVSSRTPRHFSLAEVDFVQSMANVLGTAAARAKVDAALRSERERLRLALDAGGMGDWAWDVESNLVSWSEAIYRLFDTTPEDFSGTFEAYLDLVHPDDRQRVADTVAAAMQGASDTFAIEHRTVRSDGTERWIASFGQVRRADDGTPKGVIGVAADITDRMEAEAKQAMLLAAEQEARAEAEAARDRLEFIAEASELLASSLDYRATLTQVASLAISRLADWCAIDVVDDDPTRPNSVVVLHNDPEKLAMALRFREKYPPDPETGAVAQVIRTGEPIVYPEIADETLVAAAVDEEHLADLRSLNLTSSMTVPLKARDRAIGAISLVTAESGRIYNDDDLALALELARRAAIAIDNARLYEERSQVADALQRSLLPPTRPEIPGLEVAVRYRPVGQGTEIGGDFYDVFEAREGSWAVAIGDVCGKGTAAAALTGLARDTIRGVSIREKAPRRVLRVLNEVVLRREEESRFLTVALARLEFDEGTVHMRVACAGHPLPLLVHPDGTVDEAGTPSLLLGLFPDIDPVDVHVELAPGDAVVFFTDGVIEAHGPQGLFGEGRLRKLLGDCRACDAEELAQAVLDAVSEYQPGPAQDDVAVVVLRVPPREA